MKNPLQSATFIAALAFFAMLFGAGNVIFPLMIGMRSGTYTLIGITAYLLTAVGLTLLGLLGMLLFDGNYETFFNRLGRPTSSIIIFMCMLIIGPGIGIPRLVTLAHAASTHLIPVYTFETITPLTSLIFSCLFFAGVWLITYHEKKLLCALGILMGLPLLVGLLALIGKGLMQAHGHLVPLFTPQLIFGKKLMLGLGTLDLIATLFFCSLLLTILKKTLHHELSLNRRHLAWTGLKAGLIGLAIVSIISIGLGYIGAYYGQGVFVKPARSLTIIAYRLFGHYGTIVTGALVLLACFSTTVALVVVVANYIQHTISKNSLSYHASLFITILLSIPLSTLGIDTIMRLTKGPLTYIGYPLIITITICNILHKLMGIHTIKVPVLIITLISSVSYWYQRSQPPINLPHTHYQQQIDSNS